MSTEKRISASGEDVDRGGQRKDENNEAVEKT